MTRRARKLLVVDDQARYIELFHALLGDYRYATRCELAGPCTGCERRRGCTLTHAHDAVETLQALARHPDIDAVLLDVEFNLAPERLLETDDPDLEQRRRLQGLAILERIRRARPELPVILMTSREELQLEASAERVPADELVTFAGNDPFDVRALRVLLERVLSGRTGSAAEAAYVWGESPGMLAVRRDALALARTSLPMLLLGETGTGKSALAEHALHAASGRPGAFVSVDLSALPSELTAAELFGTARGAFSGAIERAGRIEHADRGTLFLDEIGNLSLQDQRLLLLVLQDRRVTRLGETTPRAADVKVIAATNVDLVEAVRAGRFRADLYARLNPAASLRIPPLRERRGDIPALLGYFLQKAFRAGPDRGLLEQYLSTSGLDARTSASLHVGMPKTPTGLAFVLPKACLATLMAHTWPGNLRELEHVIITASMLALSAALSVAEHGSAANPAIIPLSAKTIAQLLASNVGGAAQNAQTHGAAIEPRASLSAHMRELERQLFERLFIETSGDFAAMAARLLTGPANRNEKRVRLRFNQLGLRARKLRPRD
jgi:two-component system nitrogen regulation response regulator GlnG